MSRRLPTASSAQARAHVGAMLRGERRAASACAAVLLAATGVGLLVPPLLGALVDAVLEGRVGRIDSLAAALVAVAALAAALEGLAVAQVARLGERLLAELREAVVGRALGLPLERVEAAGTGDLLARVGPDVDAISRAFREGIPTFLVALLTVALTGVGLLALDPWLVLGAAAAVPVHVVAARAYLRRSGPLFAAERVAIGEQTQRLHDALSGARALRARREAPEVRRAVGEASQHAVDRSIAASRIGATFGARLNGAELAALAGVLVAGFLLVRDGAITVGAATAAALYVHRLFDPVMTLLSLLDTVQDATASLARLVGVARLPAPRDAGAGAPDDLRLALDDVRAGYDGGPDVLHGVSLALAPGEQLAVVGASGAGKSTVARLAAAIHAPRGGTVTLGGQVPEALGPSRWRRHVALVTQETHVFAGPLLDDLRLAAPGADRDAADRALDAVGADWARTLPDGLDTVVGEGGHALSSTQAQQLALARVVLAEPDVVLLDEATAEAGSAGAAVLEAGAQAAVAGRSSLVVAHRLSHAARADRVAVMEAGRVVEAGTHAALLAADGAYARLWAAWARGR